MSVFNAELRRLLSRRLLRILFGLLILGFVIAGTIVFFNSSNESSAAVVPGPVVEPGQETVVIDGQVQSQVDDRFILEDFLEVAEEVSGLFVLFFIILGATAIGAEWTNRNLTVTLTFEPRRGLLLTSKLAAVILVAFVGAVFLELVLLACMLPAAFLRGTTEGVDGTWWADYIATILRAGGVAAFAATLGLSISTIGRNTAAALGVAFVYFAILESLLRAWKPQWAEWLIGDNIAIAASGESGEFDLIEHGPARAAVVLAVYGAVVYLISLAFFRRRDIA